MNADIAVIGLGVMGASIARNFHRRGWRVAVTNRSQDRTTRFIDAYGDERLQAFSTPQALVGALARPRKLLFMVTAGPAIDTLIDTYLPLTEPGDLLIDGGNAHYLDTERRLDRMDGTGIHFVGMGISGGEEGALNGPSMMPGGNPACWPLLQPLLESAAARSPSGPCVAWCGARSAGHYVKMVHNGIEYAQMQLLAEIWSLLRATGLDAPSIQALFQRWNAGRLGGYLLEITASIVNFPDPEAPPDTPRLLIDQILDVAGQKGTGRWTSISAIDLGVPAGAIHAAVDARALSAQKALREQVAALHGSPAPSARIATDDLEAALYAATTVAHAQGFALLRSASEAREYDTDPATVARIWKDGCILRSALLDPIEHAFGRDPSLSVLLLDPHLGRAVAEAAPAWRRVVGAAIAAGIPVPALSASLAWYDDLRRPTGTANLIQAQRDWFGAHTYRRVDDPHTPVHTRWTPTAGEPR